MSTIMPVRLFPHLLWLIVRAAAYAFVVLAVSPVAAQTANYVKTTVMLDPDGVSRNVTVSYFDGIGRPAGVTTDSPSSGMYVHSVTKHDTRGRVKHETLPYASSSPTPDFNSLPSAITGLLLQYDNDPRPFTEYSYDGLDRVTATTSPGQSWANHRETTAYGTNTQGEVAKFLVSGDNLVRHGAYPAKALVKETLADAEGHAVTTYKDLRGLTLLERRSTGDTYYVYDTRGQLRYVLPPAASQQMASNGQWNASSTVIDRYCYVYLYDVRGLCVSKKLPGCGHQQMWYDGNRRLTYSDDGNLRAAGRRRFYLYDGVGRLAVSGLCKASTAPDVSGLRVLAGWPGTGDTYGGYGLMAKTAEGAAVAVALDSVRLLTVEYYDDYAFVANEQQDTQAALAFDGTHYGNTSHASGQGHLTGRRVYFMEPDDDPYYRTEAYYYDRKGRVIHRCNTEEGFRTLHEFTKYTFTGKPEKRFKQAVSCGWYPDPFEECSYTYHPKTDAPLTVTHSANGAPAVALTSYTYDALGRTATKTIGGLETVTYGYNIRSWPTKIQSAKFTELMGYNQSVNGMTVSGPKWNGNIAAYCWRHGNGSYHGYELDYDEHDRLCGANYCGGLNFSYSDDWYYESYYYDRMGNITLFQRTGLLDDGSYGYFDDLEMEYDGNRLVSVYDCEADNDPTYQGVMQFRDIDNGNDDEYIYDANGNMTYDGNALASVTYNALNLPSEIRLDNGYVFNRYDAYGKKWSMSTGYRALVGGLGHLVSDYYTYDENFVSFDGLNILTDEGYVSIAINGTPTYHFYLRDHLGNIRVVFRQDGTVEQRNDYYPSGALMATSTGGSVQPYKYNGKELNRTAGLDHYDYGARWMDPKIGARFTTIDPMCEKYYHISPYAYCAGDPVNLMDPDGENIYGVFSSGHIYLLQKNDEKYDRLYSLSNIFRHIDIQDKSLLSQLSSSPAKDYDGHYGISNDKMETLGLFKFLADNTDVEWSFAGLQLEGKRQYFISTSHNDNAVTYSEDLLRPQNLLFHFHSHSKINGNDKASGVYSRLNNGEKTVKHFRNEAGDWGIVNKAYNKIKKIFGDNYSYRNYPPFYIYNARTRKRIRYSPFNPQESIINVNVIKDLMK